LRTLGEAAHTFDGEHLRRERRQQRGLVARARTDLEHALLTIQAERFEIPRLREWLRDCLSRPDRQRGVFIRAVTHRLRHEEMTWRRGEGPQNGEIANSLGTQLFDESYAVPAIGVAATLHFFFPARSHFLTTSSSL
jgi:hypothetical protein